MSNQTITLSMRLKTLSTYITPGAVMADIGTDHGYLPIYLVQSNICPQVLAIDINNQPLEAARKNITTYGLGNKITLRLGDGLQVLKPGEAQIVNIAGLGGNTMINILKAAPEVLAGLERIVLQPMGDEQALRHWLLTNNWKIVAENLLLEDGRLYAIIVCEQGQEHLYNTVWLEVGPRLLEEQHPLLPKLITELRAKYQSILAGLAKSERQQLASKRQSIANHLRLLEEEYKNLGSK